MTATTVERLTDSTDSATPRKGTFPAAANVLILKGTIVQIDANGRATPGVTDNGLRAVGIALATIDNRTGSPAGGAAGAIDVEVEFGVFGFLIDGTTPIPGAKVYVVDNQTISTDDNAAARGFAGRVAEVRDNVGGTAQAHVHMGPTIPAE